MDSVSNAVGGVLALQQANTQQQVDIALMRKAMDLQQTQAQALLSALPSPAQATVQTPGLGGNVNVYA